MRRDACAGITLVELLVAMTIASLVGSMILQMVIGFQSRILTEVSRNDLQDRAERLIRFLLAGDPLESLPSSIIVEDSAMEDDRLTIVKAISFSPPLTLVQPGLAGESELVMNRRPNRSPGSTRELQPTPEAINHLVLASHRACYSVSLADLTMQLNQPLLEDVPADTEVLGVRAYTYSLDPFAGSNRLRRDDFTSRDILDDAVDGLQFEYLLGDGSMVSQTPRPQDIRGVRISLLVRDRGEKSWFVMKGGWRWSV
jgi:type II secretory pathway pseudopilin PulG